MAALQNRFRYRAPTLLAALLLVVHRTPAPPPLVTGDVPTAEKGMFELYSGFRYQDTGTITRAIHRVGLWHNQTAGSDDRSAVPFAGWRTWLRRHGHWHEIRIAPGTRTASWNRRVLRTQAAHRR